MENSKGKDTASSRRWNFAHKLITVVLATVTTFLTYYQIQLQNKLDLEKTRLDGLQHQLDVEQAKLKQQVEQSKLVDQMLSRIEGYLEKQTTQKTTDGVSDKHKGLSDTDKTRILISLLKVSTEAHIGKTGKLETKKQKDLLRKIPLYFALLSENDDMLVDIGSDPEDLPLWVNFAKRTADIEVKVTAAKALKQIASLTTDGKTQAKIINDLLSLTLDWQVEDLRKPVKDVLNEVLIHVDPEEAEVIPELNMAVKEAKKKLFQLKIRQLPTPEKIAEVEDIPQTATIDQITATRDQIYSAKVPPAGSGEAPIRPQKDEIKHLIVELESKDKSIRYSARTKLAAIGEEAVSELLTALNTQKEKYRIRLGVITALLLMDQPVVLPKDKIQLITDLLGDPDSTVRKNTANFLIALTDLKTLTNVVNNLKNNLSDLSNSNNVYNSIVVLGELRKRWPDKIAKDIKKLLTMTKANLRKDRRDWKKSLDQINKYLS